MLTRSNVKPETVFYTLEISKEEYDFMTKRYDNILKWYPTRDLKKRNKMNIIRRMCLEKREFDAIVDDTLKSLNKSKYSVDIDFDTASKSWLKNKKKLGDGMYKYKSR